MDTARQDNNRCKKPNPKPKTKNKIIPSCRCLFDEAEQTFVRVYFSSLAATKKKKSIKQINRIVRRRTIISIRDRKLEVCHYVLQARTPTCSLQVFCMHGHLTTLKRFTRPPFPSSPAPLSPVVPRGYP